MCRVWPTRFRRRRNDELIIMQDPQVACLYAKNVLRGRWHEAEHIINSDPAAARDYNSYFGLS